MSSSALEPSCPRSRPFPTQPRAGWGEGLPCPALQMLFQLWPPWRMNLPLFSLALSTAWREAVHLLRSCFFKDPPPAVLWGLDTWTGRGGEGRKVSGAGVSAWWLCLAPQLLFQTRVLICTALSNAPQPLPGESHCPSEARLQLPADNSGRSSPSQSAPSSARDAKEAVTLIWMIPAS